MNRNDKLVVDKRERTFQNEIEPRITRKATLVTDVDLVSTRHQLDVDTLSPQFLGEDVVLKVVLERKVALFDILRRKLEDSDANSLRLPQLCAFCTRSDTENQG